MILPIMILPKFFRAKEMRNRPMIGFCRLASWNAAVFLSPVCNPFILFPPRRRPTSFSVYSAYGIKLPPTARSAFPIQNPKSKILPPRFVTRL